MGKVLTIVVGLMKIGTAYLRWAEKQQIIDDANAKTIAKMMTDLRELDKVKVEYDDLVSRLNDEEVAAALGIGRNVLLTEVKTSYR